MFFDKFLACYFRCCQVHSIGKFDIFQHSNALVVNKVLIPIISYSDMHISRKFRKNLHQISSANSSRLSSGYLMKISSLLIYTPKIVIFIEQRVYCSLSLQLVLLGSFSFLFNLIYIRFLNHEKPWLQTHTYITQQTYNTILYICITK